MALATLSSILAQDDAVAMLRKAMRADRLAHGLLFAGPNGVGKGTTARALARAFLCAEPAGCQGRPGEVDGCGRCASCRMMDSPSGEAHPDVHRVYRQLIRLKKKDSVARDLAVDVVRDFVVAPAGLTPQMGHGRVFIIEEAETMNSEAQNALLKTLEEPPGRTLMILLSESSGMLLSTIRSRCQTVLFRTLPNEVIRGELARRGVDQAAAAEAIAMADGSLGEALRLIEDGLVAVVKELESKLVASVTRKGDADFAKWFKGTADKLAELELKRDPDGSKDQYTREALGKLTLMGERSLRRFLKVAKTAKGAEVLCHGIESLTRARSLFDANVSVSLGIQNLIAELERQPV